MLTLSKPTWLLSESQATSEANFRDRRRLVKSIGIGSILLAGSTAGLGMRRAEAAQDPSVKLYPVQRNLRYQLDRAITPEKDATTYNNFYEFGSHKQIAEAAQALKLRPWTITFDGMVEKKRTIDIDTFLKAMPLEERLYRHRCVEAWSMAVPWAGFAMAELIKFANPLKGAKFIAMESFKDPKMAPGQKQFWYPWPYLEGLTIEEATNELAFIGTGLYGKPMPKQNGAPLRLVVPWKYGFKSIKSVVRFTFTDKRPKSFWERIQPAEYGFWANVNPKVPHPRWSQTTERVLGRGDERVSTLIYNGYAEQVANLYKDIRGERLFM